MKYLPIYGLSVLILTSVWHVIPPAASRSANVKANTSRRKPDTLAIPDDTIPNVVIPPGAIQVVTNNSRGRKNSIKTLDCSNFNYDQFVNAKSVKLDWKGLFKTKQRFYLADTKLKIKRVHSEIDDDDKPNQKTGWLVSCDNKDRNIILITGANDIVNGPVKMALQSTTLYYAGQKLEFNYYGVKYTLYTTGFKRDGKIYNYKLFLLAKVKGRYFNQLLESLPADTSFGGEGDMSTGIDIEFAGDLDGDKIPDFIISESGYSFGFSYLFLSKAAGKNAILKEVSFYGDTD